MKDIDEKDSHEVTGGVMPTEGGGGCTGPTWPEEYPRNPLAPPYFEQPLCPDNAG